MVDVFPRSAIVSGAWLYDAARDRHRIGYKATVVSMFSFGVTARVTEEVVRAFLNDEQDRTFHDFDWDDDELWYDGRDGERTRLGPDYDDRLYELPAWAWQEVSADKCDEIRGADPDKVRFMFTLEATDAWETWIMEAPKGTPDAELRAMFESGDHEKYLGDSGATTYTITNIEETS